MSAKEISSGSIRRRLPSQEKRTVTFEKRQRVEEAREAYRREHGTAGQKQRKRRQYLLVDGYNVIYAWQDRSSATSPYSETFKDRPISEKAQLQEFANASRKVWCP